MLNQYINLNCNKTQPISEFIKYTHLSVPIPFLFRKTYSSDWNNGLHKWTHMIHFSVCVYIHDVATAYICNKLSTLDIQPHIWWPKYHSAAKVLQLDCIPAQLILWWQQDGAPNLLDEILATVKELLHGQDISIANLHKSYRHAIWKEHLFHINIQKTQTGREK